MSPEEEAVIVAYVLAGLLRNAPSDDRWYWHDLQQQAKQFNPELVGVVTLEELASTFAKRDGLI